MKILCFFLTMLAFGCAQAEVYTWKDAQGRTHFGDRPPADRKAEQLELEINTIQRPQVQPHNTGLSSDRQVTIYTTDWCGICTKAKRHFKQNQVPFREYDVEQSAKGRRDYRKLNGSGVPIILVGKQRMNGFSAARFDRLYQQP
jgi:glutaredoxin